jgi:hypothetical protein
MRSSFAAGISKETLCFVFLLGVAHCSTVSRVFSCTVDIVIVGGSRSHFGARYEGWGLLQSTTHPYWVGLFVALSSLFSWISEKII